MFSFLLVIYMGVEFLGHMVAQCWTFWGTSELFSKAAAPIRISLAIYEDLNFFYILETLVIALFLILAILVGLKRYFSMVLIRIF